MKQVYLLRSRKDPTRTYTGITTNLEQRLQQHNQGKCRHTRRHRPWTQVVTISFESDQRANQLERYLKTGSGRAFTKRHFL